jgi:dienelactone hydrolase
MAYDPFQRGPHPVGVTTLQWADARRAARRLTVEAWYPATEAHRGQDLDPATQDSYATGGIAGEEGSLSRQPAVRDAARRPGTWPVVLLVHGYAGDRRESTFIGNHLASHGYLVVSADHSGSTHHDIEQIIAAAKAEGRRFIRAEQMPAMIEQRKGDIPFLLDCAIAELGGRADRAGITGASFGGWTSLIAPSLDARIKVSAPMCPSGGETPIYPRGRNYAREALDFPWPKDVATLFMVADRDSWLPLYGELELFGRARGDRRMVVLKRADHNHFVDDIAYGHEWLRQFTLSLVDVEAEGGADWRCIANSIQPYAQLCPQDLAHLCWRGLVAAHMDAHLKGLPEARALLEGDLIGALAERGIDAVEILGAAPARAAGAAA